jgi:hypothetical protein
VSDLYIDRHEREVRFLEVGAGGFLGIGKKNYLVPVEAVTQVTEARVTIEPGRTEKMAGPAPFDTKVVPRPPATGARTTPRLRTATPIAPPTPRLLVTGHPPTVLAGAVWEVTGLMAAETYLLPGQKTLCR